MAKQGTRHRRVGEQMQRELAALIQQELTDRRFGLITVQAVEVSRDLSHAKVFVTALNTEEPHEAVVAHLRQAAGFLRHELGRRMAIRSIPELHFVYDTSVERGSALSRLIDEAVAGDRNKS
ncbi:30S ribosome-binding factor RbfA [Ectothiorhodospiraceae bacterium 2226]|nr:30S ribosome-binding factor RbfA [Ectothiorhodospiraceae bacterium 2226]